MILVRECRADDFDGIVALLRQLWPDKPFDLVSLRNLFGLSLAADWQINLCAVCDQRAVGFGALTIKSNLLWSETLIGQVDEMVVDEAYRGRGIGTQILDHLISWARERGCNRIQLNTAIHRKDAHAFYEHRGFQRRAYFYSKPL
jgi:GNAT superfamily N-acetyltransferase